MLEPAEVLQRLYACGFELQTYERFPRAVGVSRGDCIVLLQAEADGLRMLGAPGWKLGDSIGVLTMHDGKQVFQAKSELLPATPERLEALAAFRRDVEQSIAWRIA